MNTVYNAVTRTTPFFNFQHVSKAVTMMALLLAGLVNAQTPKADLSAYYAMFDPQHSKTGFLFNRGFISPDQLRQYLADANDPESFVVTSGSKWRQLYTSVKKSGVTKSAQKMFPELSSLLLKYAEADVVPLGIINVEGEYLDPSLIPQYYDGNNRKLKSSTPYEKFKVFAVSNLRGRVKSTHVNFLIDPALYFSNINEQIEALEVDFGDGHGYRHLSFTKQTIAVTYGNHGEHSINVKLLVSGTALLSYSKISVSGSTYQKPSLSGSVSSVSGASSRSVAGGNYEVYYGCDNELDRPVIIVEGFDPLQSRQFTDIFDDYDASGFIGDVRGFGYDVVILKFSNNHDLIENNAQVLKALLADINTLKTGNYENIVIGESMGGLVTRVALAQLETDNIDHEVGLYISFDSPQKGVNIPLGIQELVSDVLDVDFIEAVDFAFDVSPSLNWGIDFVDMTLELLQDLEAANNSPATRQMLIRHRSNMAGINPNYLAFQNFLATTGYPVYSRNVALINGNNNAQQQVTGGGNGLLELGEKYISKEKGCNCCPVKINVDVWVSPVSTTAKVSDLEIRVPSTVLPCVTVKTTDREGTATFDQKPWDISPGSTSTSGGSDQDVFTFVPTVSSIDLDNALIEGTNGLFYYQQFSSTTSKAQLIALNQTPFDDIWGNSFSSGHVSVPAANFTAIQQREMMPVSMYLQNKTIDGGRKRDFKAANIIRSGNNVHPVSFGGKIISPNDFVIASGSEVSFIAGQQITLLPGFRSVSGSKFSARVIPNNSCTISSGARVASDSKKETVSLAEDTYQPTGPLPLIQISQYEHATSFDIGNYEPDYKAAYSWTLSGEDFQMSSGTRRFTSTKLKPGQYTIYASVNNRTTSKVFQVNRTEPENKVALITQEVSSATLHVYPNPSSGELVVSFKNDTDTQVAIYMTDVNGVVVKRLSDVVAKPAGNYSETFDVSSMPSGMYLLVIEKGIGREFQKIVILN
jgi:hypothetical protein